MNKKTINAKALAKAAELTPREKQLLLLANLKNLYQKTSYVDEYNVLITNQIDWSVRLLKRTRIHLARSNK